MTLAVRVVEKTPLGLKVALAVYACVRLPIELIAVGTLGMIPAGPGKTGMPPMDGSVWLQSFLRWDSGWYVRIIQSGYTYADCTRRGVDCAQASIAFMPGFPLLVRVFTWLGLSLPAASFIVTHVALVLALWGLWELARLRFGDEAVADRSAIALVAFPSSFFLSAGYAEPLFMAAGVWGLVFLERRQLLAAAVTLAFAAVTRSHGLLLLGAVGLVLLVRRDWRAVLTVGVVGTVVVGSYLAWQYGAFGDPLAFVHARRGWGVVDTGALDFMRKYWGRTVSGELFWEGWLDFAAMGWLIVVSIFAWRTIGPIEGVFCALIFIAPMWTGQVWALSRIALCAFPAYLLLARWSARARVALVLLCTGLTFVALSGFRFVNGLFTGS